MKFSTTLALALAPAAMAASTHGRRSFKPMRRVAAPVEVEPRGAELIWSNSGGEDAVVTTFKEKRNMMMDPYAPAPAGDMASAPAAPAYPAPAAPAADMYPAPAAAPMDPAMAPAPADGMAPPAMDAPAMAPPAADKGAAPASPTGAMPAGSTHTVVVGGPNGLVFTPESLSNVPVGDMIVFEFLSKNHTVTQSPFDTPCTPMPGGLDSGYIPNPDNTIVPAPQLAMQVTGTKPLWFFCAQGKHCGAGMVFSVNPTAEKTAAKFKELAMAQGGGDAAAPPAAPPAEGAAPPAMDMPAMGGAPMDAPMTPPAMDMPAMTPPAMETPPPMETPMAAPAAPMKGGVTEGKGVVDSSGTCVCMVQCPSVGSANSFPAEGQGVGAYGGQPGALPIPNKMMGMRR